MANKIQLRRDVANVWGSVNPILSQGEMGVEVDTGRFKFGDGVTRWVNLRYSPFDFTTSNVTEGPVNLYFTPVRAVDANAPKFTTANVAELTNLYFTEARVRGTVFSNVLLEDGRIGSIQRADGIDLYGTANSAYVQLNFNNKSFVTADANGVHLQTFNPTSNTTNQWDFKGNGTISFPTSYDINNRTGAGEALLFEKSNSQKIIATKGGTPDQTTVERLVVAGGDSYYNSNISTFVGEGGDIYLWAGRGANGGDIKVDAGNSLGSAGELGGDIKIRGGTSASGNGGFVEIRGGYGAVNGGVLDIYSGYGAAVGGDININAGTGGNANGSVLITSGNESWGFSDGNIYSPSGGVIGDVYADGGIGIKSTGNYAIIASQDLQQFIQVDNSAITVGVNWDISGNVYKYWYFTKAGDLLSPGNIVLSVGGTIKDNTGNSIIPVSLTSSAVANLLVAGNQITIEANGRISSNPVPLTGSDVANVLVAGNQITIEANGRISANVSTPVVRGLQKVTTTSSSIDLNTTKYVFVDPNAAGGNVNITLTNPQNGYDITVKNLNDGGSGVYFVTVISSDTLEMFTGGFNGSAVLSNSGTTGTWVYDSSAPAFRLISKLV